MKTYAICGSMRFADEMRRAAYLLAAREGCCVLECTYVPEGISPTDEERERLAAAHRRRIDLSAGIYVVNPGGYIGKAVQAEIAYALSRGKEVVYQCAPLPGCGALN